MTPALREFIWWLPSGRRAAGAPAGLAVGELFP